MFRNSREALLPRPRKACPGIIYNCYLLCKFNSFHYGKSAFILVMSWNMNNDYECSRLRVGVIGVFVKRKFYCATRPLEVNSSLLKKSVQGYLAISQEMCCWKVLFWQCLDNACLWMDFEVFWTIILLVLFSAYSPPFAPSCWEWRLNFVSISFPQDHDDNSRNKQNIIQFICAVEFARKLWTKITRGYALANFSV